MQRPAAATASAPSGSHPPVAASPGKPSAEPSPPSVAKAPPAALPRTKDPFDELRAGEGPRTKSPSIVAKPPGPAPVTFTARAFDLNRSNTPLAEMISTGWQAPFLPKNPQLDGSIEPAEYGAPLFVDFTDQSNPGQIISGSVSSSSDLCLYLFTGYTRTDLYLACLVYDDVVTAGAADPLANDRVEIFIDGDGHANDMMPPGQVGNREGFRLAADAKGGQASFQTGIKNGDWSVAAGRFGGGYVLEWRVPLGLIDTRDGPDLIPAADGSTVRFALAVIDRDRPDDVRETVGVLWPSDPKNPLAPAMSGESGWKFKLHLGAVGLYALYRHKAPVVDGVIGENEYGVGVEFGTRPGSNPGRTQRGWSRFRSLGQTSYEWREPRGGPASGTVFTACTDADLYVAARIRDSSVIDGDSVSIFVDADRAPGDITLNATNPASPLGRTQSAEGCYLQINAGGTKWNPPARSAKSTGMPRSLVPPDGYIAELRIPLKILDAKNGRDVVPPAPGTTMRFNLGVVDGVTATALWLDPAHTALARARAFVGRPAAPGAAHEVRAGAGPGQGRARCRYRRLSLDAPERALRRADNHQGHRSREARGDLEPRHPPESYGNERACAYRGRPTRMAGSRAHRGFCRRRS